MKFNVNSVTDKLTTLCLMFEQRLLEDLKILYGGFTQSPEINFILNVQTGLRQSVNG